MHTHSPPVCVLAQKPRTPSCLQIICGAESHSELMLRLSLAILDSPVFKQRSKKKPHITGDGYAFVITPSQTSQKPHLEPNHRSDLPHALSSPQNTAAVRKAGAESLPLNP